MIALDQRKIDLLKSHLGEEADRVLFSEVGTFGQNPARLLPAWADFVARHPGSAHLRGLGEPVWPGRDVAELAECEHHESLLNLAFDDGRPWALRCAYDTSALSADVLEGVGRTHPSVSEGGLETRSDSYRDPSTSGVPFTGALSPVPPTAQWRTVGDGDLYDLRRFVGDYAHGAGLGVIGTESIVMAANELAANSIRHGGGTGEVALWSTDTSVLCEVRDAGQIVDQLVGRIRPAPGQLGGYGLWTTNHLCDLVQIRNTPSGTAVRVHGRIR
jgi:anti-sigma regulatory factor (Ser/Thr protein kinase)